MLGRYACYFVAFCMMYICIYTSSKLFALLAFGCLLLHTIITSFFETLYCWEMDVHSKCKMNLWIPRTSYITSTVSFYEQF